MIILSIQFVLGVILLTLISFGNPPKYLKHRVVNFISAVPASVAITCSVMGNPYSFPEDALILSLILLITFQLDWRKGIPLH